MNIAERPRSIDSPARCWQQDFSGDRGHPDIGVLQAIQTLDGTKKATGIAQAMRCGPPPFHGIRWRTPDESLTSSSEVGPQIVDEDHEPRSGPLCRLEQKILDAHIIGCDAT